MKSSEESRPKNGEAEVLDSLNPENCDMDCMR